MDAVQGVWAVTELEILKIRFDGVYDVLARLCREPKICVTKEDAELLMKVDGFIERNEKIDLEVLHEFRWFLASLMPLLKDNIKV